MKVSVRYSQKLKDYMIWLIRDKITDAKFLTPFVLALFFINITFLL